MKDKYLVKHYSRGICECVFGWGHFWVGGLGKAKWSSFMCREEVKGGGPEWSILGYRSSQPSALLGSQLHLNHSSFGSLVPELRIELHQLWLFCFLKCLKLYNQTIQLFKTHIYTHVHTFLNIYSTCCDSPECSNTATFSPRQWYSAPMSLISKRLPADYRTWPMTGSNTMTKIPQKKLLRWKKPYFGL